MRTESDRARPVAAVECSPVLDTLVLETSSICMPPRQQAEQHPLRFSPGASQGSQLGHLIFAQRDTAGGAKIFPIVLLAAGRNDCAASKLRDEPNTDLCGRDVVLDEPRAVESLP